MSKFIVTTKATCVFSYTVEADDITQAEARLRLFLNDSGVIAPGMVVRDSVDFATKERVVLIDTDSVSTYGTTAPVVPVTVSEEDALTPIPTPEEEAEANAQTSEFRAQPENFK